jgi:hypothetical protein
MSKATEMDFGNVLVKVNGATIDVSANGYVVATSPSGVEGRHAAAPDAAAPANDGLFVPPIASGDVSRLLPAKSTHEIGAIESTGEHKGEIYGGIFPDGKRGWILEEPKFMTHYEAVKLKGRALPTREEGKYIDTIKGKGALKDIFARHGDDSSSAGQLFWLAEHHIGLARSQQFSDGTQYFYDVYRDHYLPVLSVRR